MIYAFPFAPLVPTIQIAVDELGRFLAGAPFATHAAADVPSNQIFNQHILGNGEAISCVIWNGSHYITLTDIERVVTARLYAIGRDVIDRRKLQTVITSFLRNLKLNSGYILESSKSELLQLLFKTSCIRSQKKQKVFLWFAVPHEQIFQAVLDRELKTTHPHQAATALRSSELRFPPYYQTYDEDGGLL